MFYILTIDSASVSWPALPGWTASDFLAALRLDSPRAIAYNTLWPCATAACSRCSPVCSLR